MAAFLAGKLVREKNGRFERHGWEKEVEICGKEGKDSWAKVLWKNILSFSNMAEYSQSRGILNRCDGPFLLSENGDLSFLLLFSKQCLVENIQGQFQKKLTGNFFF